MIYGDVDGHGRYGILDTADTGLLVCHECGAERQFLGRHVREHDLTADEYRARHGLGRSTSLVSAELSRRFSELSTERIGTTEWQRFADARDPDGARQESIRVAKDEPRPAVREVRRVFLESDTMVDARRGRRNPTVHTCPVCGAQWCVARARGTIRQTCSDPCYRKLRGWTP